MKGPLSAAHYSEVMWAWGRWRPSPTRPAHIHANPARMWSDSRQEAIPLCGARSYQRDSHQDALRHNYFYDNYPNGGCVSCLVQLVMDYPHFFQEAT